MSVCVCAGITNYDEYSLVRDIGEEKKEETMGTLKRDKTLLRDDKKMEKLKQKLHTDDEREIRTHTHTHLFSVTHTFFNNTHTAFRVSGKLIGLPVSSQ